jgi:hypothetical protein
MSARRWVSLLALLVAAAPVVAQTPTTGSWGDALKRLRDAHRPPLKAQLARRIAPVARAAASIVAESEPNDSSARRTARRWATRPRAS